MGKGSELTEGRGEMAWKVSQWGGGGGGLEVSRISPLRKSAAVSILCMSSANA